MSLLLEDILQFVCANTAYEALGIDAFWDKLPDEPNKCICLLEYDGYSENPNIEAVQRNVQVLCRNSTAFLAKTDAACVHDLIRSNLDEDSRIDFNGRFTQTVLRQTPFKLDEDVKARVVYGFNIGITTSLDS